MQDIVLHTCVGFEVRLLEKQHGIAIFKLLEPDALDRQAVTPEMYYQDRLTLKEEINFALYRKNYNSVGLFKNNVLIGICFSSITDDDQKQPWLGYFYVENSYRKTRASSMLMNYILNILYKGYTVQVGPSGSSKSMYDKLIEFKALEGGYYAFKDEVSKRLAKIYSSCNEGKE